MEKIRKDYIVCIGISEDILRVISSYFGKYSNFLLINHKFNINQLDSCENISIFVINMNIEWENIFLVINSLKNDLKYKNIPMIGFCNKKFEKEIPTELQLKFEDIILIPTKIEEILTRLEVWVKTSELINREEIKNYEVDIDKKKIFENW